jgi:hypothetical protein
VTRSKVFNIAVYTAIFLNTIIIACAWYGMPDELDKAFNYTNQAFTILFFLE